VRCIEQAETYWNLLGAIPPSKMKLTKYVPLLLLLARLVPLEWLVLTSPIINFRHDDEILKEFQAAFPDMAANKNGALQKIDEAVLKSPEGKEAWRKYIKLFESTGQFFYHSSHPPTCIINLKFFCLGLIVVSDYNFGTLIRTNAQEDYTEKNTMFITRIQFYAIEICRNRLGLNDHAHLLAKKEWKAKQAKLN
jgi:hypothetical protein